MTQGSSTAERGAHNSQVAGSIPAPATLSAFFHGDPAPQGSKRPRLTKRGRIALYEASRRLPIWRRAVAEQAVALRLQHPEWPFPLLGPLQVALLFRFRRPKRPAHSFPPIDVDKLVRSTFDALKTGGIVGDDRFIVNVWATKRYTEGCQGPGCQIAIQPITEPLRASP